VPVELAHDLGEPRALAVQFLGTIRLVPDVRLLQLALDLGETFRAAIVVKDTPSGRRGDLADP